MRGRTTIKDIAKETGLSTTAISLVLNNRPNKISEASKKRITETAERLNYRPNQQAVSLVNQRTRTLGQIIPDISNTFFSQLVQGADNMAHSMGYSLILGSSNNEPGRELDMIQSLSARGVDGILLTISTQIDARIYQELFQRLPVPVVLVDRILPSLNCTSLTYNHKKGAYLATKHLLNLGHSRIACISGDAMYANGSYRVDGFVWAHEECGAKVAEGAVLTGNYRTQSGYEMADHIIDGGFTAVFCGNDMIAFGLYKRASERGVRIPEQLSIVGFDDVEFSRLVTPALTTVRQSAYDLGWASVERIIQEIEQPNMPRQSIFFEPELIVRDSTCLPSL